MSLEALATAWTQVRVSARIPGYGALAHDTVVLRRVRGGLGQILMQSASPEAIAGKPCPWRPPCTLDVLFREQGRSGAHGIPKPFILAAERRGDDLEVVLTLFGVAVDWSPAVVHALVATLRHGIDWRGQRRDVFAPVPVVALVNVVGFEGVRRISVGSCVSLDFLTPLNAENDDPLDRPATVLARLARRVEGLARWQDVAIDEDWRALAANWAELSYDASSLRRVRIHRRSGRTAREFVMDAVAGTLCIDGVPAPLRALLAIGEQVHIGKGASEGFGRFVLASP